MNYLVHVLFRLPLHMDPVFAWGTPKRETQLSEHEQNHEIPEKAGRDGPIGCSEDAGCLSFRGNDGISHGLSSPG